MQVDGSTCFVRPWAARDLEVLVRRANDRRVWINLRDLFPHPYTEADGRAWLEHVAAEEPVTNFAIEHQGEAVGGIGLRLKDDVETGTAELGYWLGADVWGRGFATAAVRTVVAWGFDTFALRRIFAMPFAGNAASCRVLEKVGFQLEGILRNHAFKAGVVQDQLIYGLLRPDTSPKR